MLMEKRNKLRVSTPENTMVAEERESSERFRVYLPQERIMQKILPHAPQDLRNTFQNIGVNAHQSKEDVSTDTSIFLREEDEASETFVQTHLVPKPTAEKRAAEAAEFKKGSETNNSLVDRVSIYKVASFVYSYSIILILVGIILYLIFKPNEYSALMDEMIRLQEHRIVVPKPVPVPRNLAVISEGTAVVPLTGLWKYGMLRRLTTDPYNILEPGNSCMSLEGSSCEFTVRLVRKAKILKVGVYHPTTGNARSAMKDAIIISANDAINIQYEGQGYQEYNIDNESDSISFRIISNHGDKRYTSVYRIFISGYYISEQQSLS